MVREIKENELNQLLELYLHLHETSLPEESEHLKQTWQTIMAGIEETKQIQAQTVRDREEGRGRIEQLQLQYEKLKSM